MSAPPFVGRARERRQVAAWLAEAEGGHGRLLLVRGEAGIGKTRLAEVTADQARRDGWRVLWVAGSGRDVAPAYWPWPLLLRRAQDASSSARSVGRRHGRPWNRRGAGRRAGSDLYYGPTVVERADRGAFNFLVELAPGAPSWAVLPPGNSGFIPVGTFGARNLNDQLALYDTFGWRGLTVDPDEWELPLGVEEVPWALPRPGDDSSTGRVRPPA